MEKRIPKWEEARRSPWDNKGEQGLGPGPLTLPERHTEDMRVIHALCKLALKESKLFSPSEIFLRDPYCKLGSVEDYEEVRCYQRGPESDGAGRWLKGPSGGGVPVVARW